MRTPIYGIWEKQHNDFKEKRDNFLIKLTKGEYLKPK